MHTNSSINESSSEEELTMLIQKEKEGTSPIGSVFIIVNAALGAGLLSFPQAFVFAGGVVEGLVLELCLATLMAITLVVVAYATDISKTKSYQEMVHCLFGTTASIIVQICIILYTFGSCVTYIVIIGDQVEKLFELLPNDLDQQWYFDRRTWTPAIAIIVVFPLCLFRNIRFLNWPSLVGVCCCLYISLMAVIVFFMRESKNNTVSQIDVTRDPSWSSFKFFSALPIFCFGYQCHLATVPVYAGLNKKSVPKFIFIAIAAILICFCVYTLTGLFGFLTFGVDVDADVIKSYEARNTFVIIARLGLLIAMTTSYPLLAFLGRSAVDGFVVQAIQLISRKWKQLSKLSADSGRTELFRLQLISLFWFSISLTLGVFLPSIEVVITPIGGVAAMFSIVFPGFLLAMWRRKSNRNGILRKKNQPTFPMHTFCLQGDLREIDYLISTGVNMNCRDKQGRTPLHEVCSVTEFSNIPKSGTVIELAKKLVANGADPLALDHMGDSPLHCVARHRRNRGVAAYLVFECKSSLNWLNKFGQTPLDVAKESSYSILNRYGSKEPLSARCSYFTELPEVFQFLLLNQISMTSLRELARDKISVYLLPYTNEKLDQLPLPSHIKCYVGGSSFIEWMKQQQRL